MPTLEPLLAHLGPFTLVLFRFTGLFLFTPLLTSASVTAKWRVFAAAAFAIAAYPAVGSEWHIQGLTSVDFAILIAFELMVGGALGLMIGMPMIAMQMAGFIMGHQMSLSIAAVYNPELDAQGNVIGQAMFYLAGSAFVMIGGVDAAFLGLMDSLHTLPPGGLALGEPPLDLLVNLLTAGFDLAMRVSIPTIGAVILVLLCMGFVMKTMPQINVMTVGFGIKIGVGIGMLAATIFAVNSAMLDEMVRQINAALEWTATLDEEIEQGEVTTPGETELPSMGMPDLHGPGLHGLGAGWEAGDG